MAPISDVVPVLVLSGSVGSGKSTIGRCVARMLRDRDIPHALVDHEWLAYSWPTPADDRWNERVAARNLACIWSNFRSAGTERLIYCRVLEARSLLRYVTGAIPGAAATVVQLRVPLELIRQRLYRREPEPEWFLDAASALTSRLDASAVADFVVDNGERAPDEVAAEILGLVGWLR
jgi:adenylylsulfate kinase